MSVDLAAVCARHGIRLRDQSGVQPDPSFHFVASGDGCATNVTAATPAAAVGALLTARWRMTVVAEEIGYGAEARHADGCVWCEHRLTALAAVVALADRLHAASTPGTETGRRRPPTSADVAGGGR